MTDEELQDFVPQISVYARVSPEHKIRIVRAWQERGNIVAMTGDGVNDAPALKQSDIGVAAGITEVKWRDAAAMVLTDDNFATIVKAVKWTKHFQNIKNAIQFLLSEFCSDSCSFVRITCKSAGSICTGTSAVHQPSDRQPAGDRTWTGAAQSGSDERKTACHGRVHFDKTISYKHRSGRSVYRNHDHDSIYDRISRWKCSAGKYDGIWNTLQPSGSRI